MEILSLLCAPIGSYNEVTAPSSSTTSLSRSEIPGLLKGLSPVHINYLWAISGDGQSTRSLLNYVIGWVRSRGWPSDDAQITAIATTATYEALSPGRCSRCHGTGVVKLKSCPSCGGSGIKHLSNRRVAHAIGIDESSFRRSWRHRYTSILNHLAGLEVNITATVVKNQRPGRINRSHHE